MPGKLREGFTTGSAATGAALAALHLLRHECAPARVRVPLPPFASTPQADNVGQPVPRGWLDLQVANCQPGPAPELAECWNTKDFRHCDPPPQGIIRSAHASIIKDGGDDPDATSGACISATVVESALPFDGAELADPGNIIIKGGPGVGRVTLPGLPVPVGQAAINPVPRQQISLALREQACGHIHGTANAAKTVLTVFVSVPQGTALAQKTFNPRLGIEGGISILGTQGTVRPFSHAAWKATIEQGLAVAAATGCHTVCLTTGRRSERLLMERYPQLPERCFVQVADFAQFSLQAAGAMGFERIVWGCFFGKLVKLAQGHAYTHAKDSTLDMQALAQQADATGAACGSEIARCITAAHALELLLPDAAGPQVLEHVARQAMHTARNFAGQAVGLHLFHTDGRELLAL
ncbi:MAG: cobalt-precorrin-5B (C(1))-methyltransferase [Desulfovibrio sp.]|uniref:cobalt-precorrin-5B (C(1))-methyltransferase CbiD n=1 Tax=Desulfovibrio sp. TaxID=885 RepID=UPI00135EF7E4|nr:cobalt-precorrin-5B (C(1))-methyltransferase CbiD [Desulfovibrio sp.]MTJ94267.1 cobalt-precorrin-5B (C(1))-methyltransferase [Desulfovibrio sp.]